MSTALILSGGGARAAYQVGVLKAVDEILSQPKAIPFSVICGASAGAINASYMACESDDFSTGVRLLNSLWMRLHSGDVHVTGLSAVMSSLVSLFRSFANDGYQDTPWSLLDNSPLRLLLERTIRLERLTERIEAGDIEALSITALGYTSGDSVTFFESRRSEDWRRFRRVGVKVKFDHDHLLASAAIPGIYPAVSIHREYFGDGSVRQSSPLSPALHLGADKLFVVGVSHNPMLPATRVKTLHPPSLASMLVQFLNGSFIDDLEEDIERVQRLNTLLDLLPADKRAETNLASVDVMTIVPSQPFDEIAARHVASLPRSMRFLFRLLGANRAGGGASLASYLLFEPGFIGELVECGYGDAMNQGGEIKQFLTGHSTS